MIIGGNSQANWDRSNPVKSSRLEQQSPLAKDGFRASETDWTPVKPSIAVETHQESRSLRSLGSGLVLALGLALTLGASGCASLATAHAADAGRPQVVQTAQVKHEAAKPNLSYQVGKELHKTGKEVQQAAKPVLEKGKEIGKDIGKTGAKVGKEIGQAGKEVGLGVAKEATSFWKGLTGH